jgi:Cof subfamily protein (haloacid dehalogenase superfamily)
MGEAAVIKLVAFDLDGTILDGESRVSAQSIETIQRLLDKGLFVASISGRSIRRSQEPLAEWPDLSAALYVGGYNGGVVVSAEREGRRALLHEERLHGELFKELAAFSRDGDFNLICCLFAQGDNGIREEYRHSHSVDGLEAFGGAGFILDERLYERCLTGDIAAPPKIMIVTGEARREEVLAELRARLGDRVYITWAIPDRIELMPPHVDKAVALQALAREVGIGMEETLVIGDGDNDLPMLAAAGVGVLMGNAKPEVLRSIEGKNIQLGPPLREEGFSLTVAHYTEGV